MTFLQETGEQTCMYESRNRKSKECFVAMAALYQTLFNMKTSPPNLSNAVHVDTLKAFSINNESEDVKKVPNIVASFDYINLIGWKYHEKQQKSKQRGTAEFSLKSIVTDMNEEASTKEEKIKYGVLIDNGDGDIQTEDTLDSKPNK